MYYTKYIQKYTINSIVKLFLNYLLDIGTLNRNSIFHRIISIFNLVIIRLFEIIILLFYYNKYLKSYIIFY